ncbi:MAG: CRISPR-associated helicase Cas3', partial [Rhodospirillaceae bacterium]
MRKSDRAEQSVAAHCAGVACLAEANAASLGLPNAAHLLGLLHDWGKACPPFRDYLRSAAGLLDQDSEGYVDARRLKGKIDHSTAAAQWLWDRARTQGSNAAIAIQALALCLASHHSGLIDCLSPKGDDIFSRRMNKLKTETHLDEALANLPEIVARAEASTLPAMKELYARFAAIAKHHETCGTLGLAAFDHGLLLRFLFSCLIDADRFDSAAFEDTSLLGLRSNDIPDWELLIGRMETALNGFPAETEINRLRRQISDHCRKRADDERGIFTLTVPTGGGKTYAGLRFALHHAHKHGLKRIIHVIPYTSIIDQNARAARNVLETGSDTGRIVLEHHSNLEPERDTWISKHQGETWDAPVIYTTMVQFLEAAFGGGTRGVRRLHRLSGAVIVFDEAQTLPIRCVHLFCNVVNFLVRECGSSVVLSTATQPLLTAVDATKGRIEAPQEMMGNLDDLFRSLERVEVIDHTSGGREMPPVEIAALALKESDCFGNCLIVVNTKKSAMKLYLALKRERPGQVFHLSTDMCAEHRMTVLNVIKKRLAEQQPTLCVSTQLIEAGVDIDFRVVIRFLAGLDSIAQAAGRCNRNASPEAGRVHIVAPEQENLSRLPDIVRGKEAAACVLRDFAADPASLGGSLLHPLALERYFKYAFHECRKEMDYPSKVELGSDSTLLEILSENRKNVGNMP